MNKYLIDGEGLVINISPENKLLGYLDNMVDIWKKYTDGKVRVLRYKTEGDLKTFKNFYKNIGGEIESPTRNEILADSVLVKN